MSSSRRFRGDFPLCKRVCAKAMVLTALVTSSLIPATVHAKCEHPATDVFMIASLGKDLVKLGTIAAREASKSSREAASKSRRNNENRQMGGQGVARAQDTAQDIGRIVGVLLLIGIPVVIWHLRKRKAGTPTTDATATPQPQPFSSAADPQAAAAQQPQPVSVATDSDLFSNPFKALVSLYSGKNYARFNGRARRREYWMTMLGVVLGSFIVYFIACYVIGRVVGGELALAVIVLFSLSLIVPMLALKARRLHDIGMSGWMQLIVLIPYVGSIALIVLYCLDSKPGRNQYGESEKYPGGQGGADTGSVAAAQAESPDAYYLLINNVKSGPYTREQADQILSSCAPGASVYWCTAGMTEWVPLNDSAQG